MHQEVKVVGTELQVPVDITDVNDVPILTADDVFPTDPLPVPPAVPDAHRATITAVETKHFDNEKGTVALIVHLRSLDNPMLEVDFPIFLPKMFADNIKVDPNTLPEEPGNKQRTSYSRGVANSDGTATIQKLHKLAYDAGRTIYNVGITQRSTNIDEYGDNHNKLLTGLEVVFFRNVDKRDEDSGFGNRLRVKAIVSIDTVNSPNTLKKYKKAWLQED